MVARLSGHHPGGPDRRTALHHPQRIVGYVENDIGVVERRRAELARQPAPALHVDDHGIDGAIVFRTVDRLDGALVEHAGWFQIGAVLELAHRFGNLGIVTGVVGILGDAELGAQLRHARIFHHDLGLLLAARGRIFQRRTIGDLKHRSIALAAQFGQFLLQLAVKLVRRVVALQRRAGVLRRGDIGEHLGRIGRMIGIEDVRADLRPVHPAALGLTRVVEHAGGQFQFGIRERIRRRCSGEIRHRIVGGIEAVGRGVLEPCNHALGACGEGAALRPQPAHIRAWCRIFRRQRARPCGQNISTILRPASRLQFVGDRLIRRRDTARGLDRFFCGFDRRCRLDVAGGAAAVSAGLVSTAFSVVLAASGTDAVVSGLKSLTVGGGTFAGSGRGIAASIARSAGVLRAGSPCANAAVADTVRKVAATAISTRSNPARPLL